jgi:large subunit ribosomal protein L18
VRRSLKHTIVQFITYKPKGDLVLVSASSKDLKKLGWTASTSNLPAAYLTGYLAGKRAAAKKIESAVLDIGLNSPIRGSKVFASLRGMLDAGIEIPHGDDIFPNEERITGKHISDNTPELFENIKNKINSEYND